MTNILLEKTSLLPQITALRLSPPPSNCKSWRRHCRNGLKVAFILITKAEGKKNVAVNNSCKNFVKSSVNQSIEFSVSQVRLLFTYSAKYLHTVSAVLSWVYAAYCSTRQKILVKLLDVLELAVKSCIYNGQKMHNKTCNEAPIKFWGNGFQVGPLSL